MRWEIFAYGEGRWVEGWNASFSAVGRQRWGEAGVGGWSTRKRKDGDGLGLVEVGWVTTDVTTCKALLP